MRKLLLLVLYFTLTPCVLLASILLLAWYSYAKQGTIFSFNNGVNLPIAYTALPDTTQQVTQTIASMDIRITKLTAFLTYHKSNLANPELIQRIITDADTYQIDYRLVPAIALQESQGCKTVPKGSKNNCWGLGIYTHHNQPFDNYQDGIDAASKTLAKYKNMGLISLEQIGSKWNPGNTNDWVGKVNYFENQIENEPIIAYLTNL